MRINRSRDPRAPLFCGKMSALLFADVSAACEILTDLHHSRDEAKTSTAIKTLKQLLYNNPQVRSGIFSAARSRGGVSALLGILRSSQSIPLLTDAASCLSLLVHDNGDAVEELASADVLSTLLPLLYPRSERRVNTAAAAASLSAVDSPYPLTSPSLAWSREWLPVYEATLSALRKLTYHSPSLQTTFAARGGIRLILELSTNPEFVAATSSFSSTARDKLAELTLWKKFITRAVPAPENIQKRILKSFPALVVGSSSPYPCYLVDLLTVDKEWVADKLIETQLVWPSHAPFPPEGTEPVWTCVSVVCVEDAGHVWCQFCVDRPKPKIEAMAQALRDIAPPTGEDGCDEIPDAGELCIAYFDPRYCRNPSSIETPFWGRACLLWVEPGMRLHLFSIDYGFTATLPLSHVLPLPPLCRGIPALAIPCRLVGVAPVPVCTVVQENAAGILRNISFEKTAFRKEIIAFDGVEALMKLARSCDVGVAEQATAALLNMAVSEAREMGKRGAVETLLALVLQDPPHPTLLPLSLGALYTLVARCPANQHRLVTQRAGDRLSAMLAGGRVEEGQEREKLRAIVKTLEVTIPTSDETYLRGLARLGGVKGEVAQSLSASPPKRAPSQPSTSLLLRNSRRQIVESPKSQPLTSQTHNRPRNRGSAVYRCLGDREQQVPESGESEGGVEGGSEGEGGSGVSGGVATDLTYTHNSILPFREDDTHDFKDVDGVKDITRGMLLRSVCAMANSGRECTIYVGVSSEGRVHGVKIGRKERDLLCVAIDGIMHNSFSPSIKHNRYKVLFVPVVPRSHSPHIPNSTHVLQIEIRGGGVSRREVCTVVRTRDGVRSEECFIRCGKNNVQTSPQELRDMLARRESSCHGNEISGLLRNIGSLRVTLDQITTSASGGGGGDTVPP